MRRIEARCKNASALRLRFSQSLASLVIVGAVTTAWDVAHTVVAAMGDRFVLIRADSHVGRIRSGTMAVRNTGNEV